MEQDSLRLEKVHTIDTTGMKGRLNTDLLKGMETSFLSYGSHVFQNHLPDILNHEYQ